MDINNYIPILRTKLGEQEAIRNMDSDLFSKFTPLYEYRKISKKEMEAKSYTLKNHIKKTAKNCAQSWQSDKSIIFDTPGFHGTEVDADGVNVITLFYSELALYDLNLIPTITTDRDTAFCKRIKEFSKSFMFRIQSDDLNTPTDTVEIINDQLLALESDKANCHLLLDFKYRKKFDSSDILDLIATFTDKIEIEQWRSITFSGCCFPEDMTGIEYNKPVLLPRHNFSCWQELNLSSALIGALLKFGDYGIINPMKTIPDAFIPDVPPKMRYTTKSDWLIFRGEHFEDLNDKYAEHRRIASNIVGNQSFVAREFSWGDESLFQCSEGKLKLAQPVKSIAIDLNHHITFVSQQVTGTLLDLEN